AEPAQGDVGVDGPGHQDGAPAPRVLDVDPGAALVDAGRPEQVGPVGEDRGRDLDGARFGPGEEGLWR
ncbi:hypothetical protein, partial [Escherichia coli]|uniref:hypothetical protein n=1 Tax=Escherichia coli TaxID=562 RepID=UPI002FC584BC